VAGFLPSNRHLSRVNIIPILSTVIEVTESARDLGIVIDTTMTMSAQVTALRRAGFYQLR